MPDLRPYAHILVPVDYAGCAFEVVGHAARLAEPFRANVTLLYVVSTPAGAHAADAALHDEATDELRALAGAFGPNTKVGIEVRHGEPIAVISACIEEHGVDLVVMGTHARTGLRRLVLGSVAEQVVRRSPVPVVVVRGPGTVMDAQSPAWTQARAETEG